ncbi:MAG: hypothetical protein WC858_03260 [Parcubacteria group bacterium]|jgi:hypothetical protein
MELLVLVLVAVIGFSIVDYKQEKNMNQELKSENLAKSSSRAKRYFNQDEIKNLRREIMKETSAEVGEIMLSYLQSLKEENEELYNICVELPLKKRHKLETRSFLLRMVFEICSGKDWNGPPPKS